MDHFGFDLGDVVQVAVWQPNVNIPVDHEKGKHVGVISYFTPIENPIDGATMFVTLKDDVGNGELTFSNKI